MHFYFHLIKPVRFKMFMSAKFSTALLVLLVLFVRSTFESGFILFFLFLEKCLCAKCRSVADNSSPFCLSD